MAERPRNRKVNRGLIEQGGVTPLRALMVGLLNRRERKKDRKYQKSLKKMGMFDEGGGRANVPPKGGKSKPKQKPKSDTEKLMNESRKKYRPRPPAFDMPSAPPKKKKSSPKKMKPMKVYKTAKGGRIDGIAIRGKTKGTIR